MPKVSEEGSATVVTDEEFSSYVGKNAETYIRKFRKFSVGGVDKFALTWHWPAFFLGFWWLLYRKLYVWALIAFLLSIVCLKIPYWFFVNSFIYALIANFIYYNKAKKNILKYKNVQRSADPSQAAVDLSKIGGVRKTLVEPLAVICSLGLMVFSVNYPCHSDYKTRSYNSTAWADIRNAATAKEAYFADHEKYAESIELLVTPEYGLYIDEQVVISILKADSNSYFMFAYHKKGNKHFFMNGPDGGIKEIEG